MRGPTFGKVAGACVARPVGAVPATICDGAGGAEIGTDDWEPGVVGAGFAGGLAASWGDPAPGPGVEASAVAGDGFDAGLPWVGGGVAGAAVAGGLEVSVDDGATAVGLLPVCAESNQKMAAAAPMARAVAIQMFLVLRPIFPP